MRIQQVLEEFSEGSRFVEEPAGRAGWPPEPSQAQFVARRRTPQSHQRQLNVSVSAAGLVDATTTHSEYLTHHHSNRR